MELLVNEETPINLAPGNLTGPGWQVRLDSTHFPVTTPDAVSGTPKVKVKLRITGTLNGSGGPYTKQFTTEERLFGVFNWLYTYHTTQESNGVMPGIAGYASSAASVAYSAKDNAATWNSKWYRKDASSYLDNQNWDYVKDGLKHSSIWVIATHGAPEAFWDSYLTEPGDTIKYMFVGGNGGLGGSGTYGNYIKTGLTPLIADRAQISTVTPNPNLFILYSCESLTNGGENSPIYSSVGLNVDDKAVAGFTKVLWSVVSPANNTLPNNINDLDPSNLLDKHFSIIRAKLALGKTLQESIDSASLIWKTVCPIYSSNSSVIGCGSNPMTIQGDTKFRQRGVSVSPADDNQFNQNVHPDTWYWIPSSSRG